MTKWPGSTHLQKKDGDSQPHLWMNAEVSGPSADTCPGEHLHRRRVGVSKSLLIWSWSDYVAQYPFNTSYWSHPTCSLTVIAGGSPWCSYWLYLDLGPLVFICMLLDWVWKRKLNRCNSWVPDCFFILWKGSPGATSSVLLQDLYFNHSWADLLLLPHRAYLGRNYGSFVSLVSPRAHLV